MSEVLVAARGLARHFDVSPPLLNRIIERRPRLLLKAVDGISFDILRRETFALVGESGCGKSTVARLAVGLYRPTEGNIGFDGVDLGSADATRLRGVRRRLQMIFQDPYASLNPRWRVRDIIAEPIRLHEKSVGRRELHERVDELLRLVKLGPEDALKYPHEFSGGQRQRISIARALASTPEFIVCDEPTSALDVSVQAQILNLMKDLQERLGLTYLFISHNLAVVGHFADRVGVMYLGRLVEIGPAAEIFRAPKHPYTRLLIETVPVLKAGGIQREPVAGEVPSPTAPPSGCAFNPRCAWATDRCRRERPSLAGAEWAVACHAVEERRLPVPESV
jgi:peptide/nickel transport system ATP-binding protein